MFKENKEKLDVVKESVGESLRRYADEWVHEGITLLKRLQVAVIIIAVAWMIFALGALVLLAYVILR